MLEAVWLNRIRQTEGVTVATKTSRAGDLQPGNTYVASGVELRNGGELDVVLFRVDDGGEVTVTKAWEVGTGKLKNKPDRQLRTNLIRAEEAGSTTHSYLDAAAFSRQSTEAKHSGYVGLSDEYDHSVASESVPESGAPIYSKSEFNQMNHDLNIETRNDAGRLMIPSDTFGTAGEI